MTRHLCVCVTETNASYIMSEDNACNMSHSDCLTDCGSVLVTHSIIAGNVVTVYVTSTTGTNVGSSQCKTATCTIHTTKHRFAQNCRHGNQTGGKYHCQTSLILTTT